MFEARADFSARQSHVETISSHISIIARLYSGSSEIQHALEYSDVIEICDGMIYLQPSLVVSVKISVL